MSSPYQSSGSAGDVSVQASLPIELNYQLPSSLPAAKNFEIRVQPVNAQSFQAGNVVQVDIPCGRRGQYMDCSTSYLRFRATYTSAGTVATDYSRLLGSAYSYFIKQDVYANNSVILESINELGVLASMLLNCQLNDADKRGLSNSMGFAFGDTYNVATTPPVSVLYPYAPSSTAGHRIYFNALNEGLVFEYSIPILGILGSQTEKFMPIGDLYGLRAEWTMDSFSRFTCPSTANLISGCTISDVEFVANVIELSPEAQMLIEQANPDKIHIRTQTYRQASNTLNGGAQGGTNDLLVGIRVSSLKSLYMACSNLAAIEGKFSGINPNLDQGTAVLIAGQQYPQRGLNPSTKCSDCFMELQKSFGALCSANFNGCITKQAYNTSSATYGLCTGFGTTINTILTNPNQFYFGIDTEVVARKQNLLSGINVNASPMFMRCQIGTVNLAAGTHTLNFFGYYDVILELDRASKNMVAKF